MHLRSPLRQRRGATVVECAIVYPVAFFAVIGLIVGGLGVFRYQQTAWLAREGARYAAVRGGEYHVETGQVSPNEEAIRAFLVSQSTALNTSREALTVQVVLNVTGSTGSVTPVAWDSSNKAPFNVISDNGRAKKNTVSVTVRYQWLPELLLVGPFTLSSTATIPMEY